LYTKALTKDYLAGLGVDPRLSSRQVQILKYGNRPGIKKADQRLPREHYTYRISAGLTPTSPVYRPQRQLGVAQA
jgi:hypothetical protein